MRALHHGNTGRRVAPAETLIACAGIFLRQLSTVWTVTSIHGSHAKHHGVLSGPTLQCGSQLIQMLSRPLGSRWWVLNDGPSLGAPRSFVGAPLVPYASARAGDIETTTIGPVTQRDQIAERVGNRCASCLGCTESPGQLVEYGLTQFRWNLDEVHVAQQAFVWVQLFRKHEDLAVFKIFSACICSSYIYTTTTTCRSRVQISAWLIQFIIFIATRCVILQVQILNLDCVSRVQYLNR